jgi:hypothetical protein
MGKLKRWGKNAVPIVLFPVGIIGLAFIIVGILVRTSGKLPEVPYVPSGPA